MIRAALWLLGSCALSFGVLARPIHYGAVTDPGLLACDQQHWQGQGEVARSCYRRLIESAALPAVRAEAAWALGDLKLANRWFQEATASAPADASVLARWGWLFSQSHQSAEAQRLFDEALAVDPELLHAQVGMAHVLAEGFSARAAELAQHLASNISAPAGVKIQALLLQARLALEEGRVAATNELLDSAGQQLRSSVWPALELLALRAAAAAVADSDMTPWVAAAQKLNPAYGDIFAVPAYFMVVNRHYDKAIEGLEQALKVQPDLWSARRELAVNLMRVNRMDEARAQLELAYQGDPFDPRTVNTLRLLDTFADYRIRPWPAAAEPQLLLRLHATEAEPLGLAVENLAREAIGYFSRRYKFALREAMVVELYPNHEDFAVRTVGLPGIGILGATFGYLVAMDSPAARPPDSFHWATTLWHEAAHVFTLKMSDHRVSRWFSEGMSVYEEWHSGPLKGRRIPVDVLAAIADNRLLPVAELDRGFVRPTYPQQVIVSYMQAGLVCEFIARRYGFDRLLEILNQYRLGADTRTALETGLSQPLDQIEAGFKDYVSNELGGQLIALEAWRSAHDKAAAAASQARWRSAEVNARLAIALLPDQVGADSDYLVVARARAQAGDREGELDALERFWQHGGYQPEALLNLAGGFEAAGRRAQAIEVLQTLHLAAPLQGKSRTWLGTMLLASGQPEPALAEFKIALALEPLDQAAAHLNLARAHFALDQTDQAQLSVLSALEIAPHYKEAQKLLLQLTRARAGS